MSRRDTQSGVRSELLADLFDTTSDLIQIFGVDGCLRLVNRAWCERLGFSEMEAIGKNVFDLIAPDCQEHCRQLFQSLLSGQNAQSIECAFINRHGRRLSLEGQVNVVFVDGVPIEFRGIFRDVSERKAAEQALRRLNESLEERVKDRTAELQVTRARLEEAQRLASVGHWEMDLVSGDLHWSDEICRICGFDPLAITPSYSLFIETVHPADRGLLEQAYQDSLVTLQPCDLRYRLLLRDGSVRYVHARWVTRFDLDGRPIRSIGTTQDVTDFECAQRDLEESETKLRSLFEASPLGLVLVEGGERCSMVNAAFERICGLQPQAGPPSCWSQSLPQPLQDLLQVSRAALAAGVTPRRVRQWRRADGSSVPVELQASAVPSLSDDGKGSLVWVEVADISDRLAAEDGLRLAAKVFHSAAEGIFLTNPDGVIVDVNDALCRITGYGRDEMLGQTPRLFKSGLHSAEFYQQMWETLESQGVWSGEIINRASDGTPQELLETISVVRDDQQAVVHYVALLTDIRQLKQQQRQLERLALYDALTGLPNRILLAQQIQASMAAVERAGGAIAICYMDLDGFKEINDRHGHAAGDSVLRTLSQRMNQLLPPTDLVARLGGDEFVAVLHGVQFQHSQPLPLVAQLLDVLVLPVIWNELELRLTASIGVTVYGQGSDPCAPEQLLRIADQAMYEAKRQGKNRYCLRPPEALS